MEQESGFGHGTVLEGQIAGDQAAMPFEQGFGLHDGDDRAQQLVEEPAFFGEHLALGIQKAPGGECWSGRVR